MDIKTISENNIVIIISLIATSSWALYSPFLIFRRYKSIKKLLQRDKVQNTIKDICINIVYFIIGFALPLGIIIMSFLSSFNIALVVLDLISMFNISAYIGFLSFMLFIRKTFKKHGL